MQEPRPIAQPDEPAASPAARPYRQLGVSSVAAALDLEIAITAAIDQFMQDVRTQHAKPGDGPNPAAA